MGDKGTNTTNGRNGKLLILKSYFNTGIDKHNIKNIAIFLSKTQLKDIPKDILAFIFYILLENQSVHLITDDLINALIKDVEIPIKTLKLIKNEFLLYADNNEENTDEIYK